MPRHAPQDAPGRPGGPAPIQEDPQRPRKRPEGRLDAWARLHPPPFTFPLHENQGAAPLPDFSQREHGRPGNSILAQVWGGWGLV